MTATRDELTRRLQVAGFHIGYRSTAVTIFVHPAHPGLEVRLGTLYLVAERDTREIYRASLMSANVERLLSRLRE